MSDSIPYIVSQLPVKLQNRLNSLGSYVEAVVEEYQSDIKVPAAMKLGRDQIQTIQAACTVHFLLSFFKEGSRAARSAVTSLQSFGLSGVAIGATEFQGENANVRRGDRLAKELEQLLSGNAVIAKLRRTSNLRHFIEQLVREATDEKAMGRD